MLHVFTFKDLVGSHTAKHINMNSHLEYSKQSHANIDAVLRAANLGYEVATRTVLGLLARF